MKTNTKMTGLVSLQKLSLCLLQVSGNTPQQFEKFKYFWVLFMSDRRWKKKIDTQISNAHAVLYEIYCCVVTK